MEGDTKIGLLAYSSDTGLGNQTWEIYRHIAPAKVLIADLSMYNKMPTHHDRYKLHKKSDVKIFNGIPDDQAMEWLTEGMDAVFVCETPLNYHLFEHAKSKGVVTIQQYNYEFLDYFRHPEWPKPSILAAPSEWNTEVVRQFGTVMDWPVPINRRLIPYREITECNTFVHIIGRPAVHDRNGTLQFLQAMRALPRKFRAVVYVQPPVDARAVEYYEPVKQALQAASREINLEIIEGVADYADMYKSGDVLVLPRRYGGLCLPMQEALSAGMPVVMTDVSPNNAVLPPDWLARSTESGIFFAHTNIPYYTADVDHLAERMLSFDDPEYMAESNKMANAIADTLSWDTLGRWYTKVISELCI